MRAVLDDDGSSTGRHLATYLTYIAANEIEIVSPCGKDRDRSNLVTKPFHSPIVLGKNSRADCIPGRQRGPICRYLCGRLDEALLQTECLVSRLINTIRTAQPVTGPGVRPCQ
ncbi:hypothetical protein LSH36_738g01026 [Paralvinella palmiformis]|uniref:Uncharacterized protein n=1 Tax=Paralvinella palmiformis TaxID=53620 RepID=A0AAD9MUU7_9ANNE|nr:hypothetical protein LSH36_738g01026 [Paralvinella palmiformis]